MISKSILLLGVALAIVAMAEAETLVGSKQESKPVTDKVRGLVTKLDADIKKKINEVSCANKVCLTPDKLEAILVKEQTVSGTNYYIKIVASEGAKKGYYHVTIWEQPWTDTLQVTKVEGPKEESTPL